MKIQLYSEIQNVNVYKYTEYMCKNIQSTCVQFRGCTHFPSALTRAKSERSDDNESVPRTSS